MCITYLKKKKNFSLSKIQLHLKKNSLGQALQAWNLS